VCLVIGTKKFAEALKKGDADLNLIGQFGTFVHAQRNKPI
jgi:HSP90 family molecular chaperone